MTRPPRVPPREHRYRASIGHPAEFVVPVERDGVFLRLDDVVARLNESEEWAERLRARAHDALEALMRIANYDLEVKGLEPKFYGHAAAIARRFLDLPMTGPLLPEDRATILAALAESSPPTQKEVMSSATARPTATPGRHAVEGAAHPSNAESSPAGPVLGAPYHEPQEDPK